MGEVVKFMRKTTSIRVKLSASEKSMIEKFAENMSMSISGYVRTCCILKPPTKAKIKRKKEDDYEYDK